MSFRLLHQAGYSMIELFMVIAISAILLGLGLPSLSNLLGESDVTASTNELVFSLQSARSEAVKRSSAVTLCPSDDPLAVNPACTTGGDYAAGWIVFSDDNTNGSLDTGENLIRQQGPASGSISMTPNVVFADRVLFSSTGLSTNTAGVPLAGAILVDYANGEEQRQVFISANGRIDAEEVP